MKVLFLILSISLVAFAGQADAKKTRTGTKGVKQDVLISIRNIKNLLQGNEVDVMFSAYGTSITGYITLEGNGVKRCRDCDAWTKVTNGAVVYADFQIVPKSGFFSAGIQDEVTPLRTCIEGSHGSYSTYHIRGYRNFFSRNEERIIEFQARCILRPVDNTEPSESPNDTVPRHEDTSCGADQPKRSRRMRDMDDVKVCDRKGGRKR